MRDLIATLADWAEREPEMAIATVVATAGSTPRQEGARLLVDREGHMVLAGLGDGGLLAAEMGWRFPRYDAGAEQAADG